jgi:hypothetical protein
LECDLSGAEYPAPLTPNEMQKSAIPKQSRMRRGG